MRSMSFSKYHTDHRSKSDSPPVYSIMKFQIFLINTNILKYLESGWPHGNLRKNSRKLGKNHKLSPDFEVLFVFLLSGWLPKIFFFQTLEFMKSLAARWKKNVRHEIHDDFMKFISHIYSKKIFHRIGHSIF